MASGQDLTIGAVAANPLTAGPAAVGAGIGKALGFGGGGGPDTSVRDANSINAYLKPIIDQFKDLQNQVNAGQLSQAEYVKQAEPIFKQTMDSLYGWGRISSNVNNKIAGNANEFYDLNKNLDIYKAANQYLGRDITPAELAMIKPKFADGAEIGNAYIAEMAKQEASSPAALGKKAGQYSGDVNSMFNELLKRGATKDELDYFGRALASGQTTAYQLSQYVQSLPEYQGQQDTKFRGELQNELSNYDTNAFNKEKENILGSYSRAGLGNSSALDFAITDALSKMQTNRDQFLGGLSAQQYGGNKAAALDTYKQSQNQYLQNQDYQRNLGQSNLNYLTGRADSGADYQRQMGDYLNYLNNQPKQKGPGALETAIGVTQAAAPWAYLFA